MKVLVEGRGVLGGTKGGEYTWRKERSLSSTFGRIQGGDDRPRGRRLRMISKKGGWLVIAEKEPGTSGKIHAKKEEALWDEEKRGGNHRRDGKKARATGENAPQAQRGRWRRPRKDSNP